MAFVKLQEENLSNPRPGLLYTLFRSTHPSIGDRIDFCNSYHPWRADGALELENTQKKMPDLRAGRSAKDSSTGGLFSSVPDRRSVPACFEVAERGTDR